MDKVENVQEKIEMAKDGKAERMLKAFSPGIRKMRRMTPSCW